MAIVCPHCEHGMNVKSLRAGRFSPKCSKCGQVFVLDVTLNPEPTCKTSKPAPVVDLGKTVSPEEASGNPNFSVSPSIIRSAPEEVETTTAIEQTSNPVRRKPLATDVTEAEQVPATPAQQGEEEDSLSGILGGYHIEKELGRGGMGAVYLARQASLDRPVALKVMNSRWASNPNFLVRFTREAYAAAQLVHHNVVQVHDIGEDRGINFFSMEFVEGRSLGELVRTEGPLPPEAVAGYILQAARGLQFAHERGMIHRDIKPDNLMLNNQGLVKVADLGLVRTPGSDDPPQGDAGAIDADAIANRAVQASQNATGRTLNSLGGVTLAGRALGTPSYMAPEQARDSTAVDARADVYSLGCTMYVLLTGQPVFEGTTALEVMTKHAHDPVKRPELFVKEIPRALSDITLRMLAKQPADRYASMDEVIQALEAFLGLQGAGKQAASESHIRTLEQGCKAFRQIPAARLRSLILLGFLGGCAGLFLVLALFKFWKTGGFFLGLGLLTAAAYGLVHGSARRSHMLVKLREFLLGCTWLEWVRLGLAALLLVGMLYLVGLLWVWLAAALLGVGLALGLHYTLDRRIATQQSAALEKVERMLKSLRVRGLSEDALQEFVAKYAGDHWEEVFEALFGFEAKLAARSAHGQGPKGWRPRHATWREPIVRAIDRFQRARQEARERKHLQKVEQKRLEAKGVGAAEAKQQAERVADAMVQKAAEIKKEEAAPIPHEATVVLRQGVNFAAAKPAPPQRVSVQDLFMVAHTPTKAPAKGKPILPGLLAAPFGSTTRLFVAAVLLVGCLLWMNNRNLLPSSTNLDDETVYVSIWQRMKDASPLEIPLVPEVIPRALSSINAGVAGLVMLFSCIWRSWKIGFWELLGAAIMVIGPVSGFVPEVGPLTPNLTCLAGGGAVMALGFLIGRDT